MQERRRQEEERLLAALPQPMGFNKGRPMAALVVFRCCLQWRAFQADRTSVFDRIIHVRWLVALRLVGWVVEGVDAVLDVQAWSCLEYWLWCSLLAAASPLLATICTLFNPPTPRHMHSTRTRR